MKKVKGFTLIELVVVMAIIGILSMILIPALMGWMSKSRITTSNNNSKEVFTQIQLVLSDFVGSDELPDCRIDYNGTNFHCSTTLTSKQMTSLQSINSTLTDMADVIWAAEIENNSTKCVALSKNNCINVGGFPVQCPPTGKYNMPSTHIEDYLDYASGALSWSALE